MRQRSKEIAAEIFKGSKQKVEKAIGFLKGLPDPVKENWDDEGYVYCTGMCADCPILYHNLSTSCENRKEVLEQLLILTHKKRRVPAIEFNGIKKMAFINGEILSADDVQVKIDTETNRLDNDTKHRDALNQKLRERRGNIQKLNKILEKMK
jgi:hypothetical protein